MIRSLQTLAVIIALSPSPGFIIAAEETAYISPGIAVSWDIGRGLVFGVKASLGYAWEGRFVNITVGGAFCQTDDLYPYTFVQCQAGAQTTIVGGKSTPPFLGGGLGFVFARNDTGRVVFPYLSAFAGFLIFINVDFLMVQESRVAIGAELDWPIPLPPKKFEFGSIGG